ncbi:MAG: SGNH/GDSL hydrolase family protein [Myxococcota bacterium]|nr:SGNH/GDSL hydrolase family protein [Myxococcota bacterium]
MVVLLEGGLRIVGDDSDQLADILGWRMQLNAQNLSLTDPQNNNTFVVNTNSDGLRTAIQRDKPPQLMRIAIMGDSTVFGWGVDDSDTMAVRLQDKFNAENPMGKDEVEVINAAQPGYSTVQVFKIFEDTVQHYKPDWTIVFPSFHDDRPALVSDWEMLRHIKWSRYLSVFLSRYSRTYTFLHTKLNGPITDDVSSDMSHRGIVRVNGSERTEVVLAMQKMATQWNGRVMLAAMLFGKDVQQDKDVAEEYALWHWMQSVTQKHPDIPLLDLRLCCHGGQQPFTIAGDSGHLNARGNDKVAECIAAKWHPNKD